MNQYDEQALRFITKTNTKVAIKFLKYGTHFVDDKEERDVYDVTLTRGERIYNFQFGQSINESGYKLTLSNGKSKKSRGDFCEVENRKFSSEQKYTWLPDAYKKCGHDLKIFKKIAIEHLQSLAGFKIIEPKAPSVYDILSALQKYDVGTLEEFCSEFGYDNDSIKATKIYDAVREEYGQLLRLYSDDEMDMLREIQ